MKKIVLSVIVASALAFAGQGEYKSELSVYVGGVKPEGNLNLDNQLNLGLRYGVYFENQFFDIIEGGFERASGVDYENSTQDTNINRLFANLIKEYDLSKKTALYSLVGVGYEDYTDAMFNNKDGGFVQYGVGAKYWVTDQFALKAELRHGITFDGDNNLFYSLGFAIPFGKKAVKEAPVKPEPAVVKEEPKPVVLKEEPKVVPVKVAKPISLDDDNDGVLNEVDKCPATLAGKVVDSEGCLKIVRLNVKFAHDSSNIMGQYSSKIREVVDFMNENRGYSVVIDGHTDSRGREEYNKALSLKRASAVAEALKQLGVDSDRIVINGYGETNPIATNETLEGRAQNRRVDTSFNK